MDVGLMMIFSSYGWEGMPDQQVWQEDLRLAGLAADLGFDALWSAEHHFFDYSFCPDNVQLMTWLAAKHPKIDLGTAAVILPWHDPLRVAEQVAMLDLLSGGRLRFGMGRGLARREFVAFRGSMDETRARFDEAAPMIVEALRTGVMEGAGPLYPQPRAEIRPRPPHGFDGRIYAVASSEDSVASCARLGARMIMFSDRPWPMRMPSIELNRRLHREFHGGRESPGLMIVDFGLCWPDDTEAEDLARQYMGKFVESNFHHYEFLGEHFATVKGYDSYAQKAAIAKQSGLSGATEGFMKAAAWGRPERMLRMIEERRALIGDFEMAMSFRFGGIPIAHAEASLRLFAKEVLPVLKSWGKPSRAAAE
ncbi:MAG: LLM class flavin-dependent oxidoreductase [Acetobacteraceae bacterium]|nr:LLM class flavin-dependent oxidoreductase [Acetobacteraceae bacterium]